MRSCTTSPAQAWTPWSQKPRYPVASLELRAWLRAPQSQTLNCRMARVPVQNTEDVGRRPEGVLHRGGAGGTGRQPKQGNMQQVDNSQIHQYIKDKSDAEYLT